MTENITSSSTSYQITPWEQVDISNHFMFRLVMENPELCKIALERILGIKITKLEVLIAEKSVEYTIASKGIRLDIYAEDDKGVAYDFEMQSTDRDKNFLGKRTRYYQSLLDGDALKKNTPYSKLRKSYVIFICKFDPFDRNFGRYTFNSWCDEDKSLNLRDDVTKILLNTKGDMTGMSEELKAFLKFIDTNSPTDKYTEHLASTVQTIKKNQGARDLYMTIEQQRLEDIAYTETRVREEMQKYIVAANNRADKAEQEATNAKQEATNARQEATNAKQEATNAKQEATNAKQEAANAKQEAANAKQEATNAKQEATNAKQEAANAKQKNIASIIGICRDVNFSDEQTIKQLIEKASLTREEAIKALNEY